MSWQITSKSLKDYMHKVKEKNGCWEWQAHKNAGGYGTQTYGSRIDGSRKHWLAHRLFYKLKYGDFDTNLKVCHTCDNRACVNPDHLFLGTQQDNVTDMMNKNRHARLKYDKNPNSKLKPSDIARIRVALELGARQVDIAQIYGVNQTLISAIKRGVIWV